MNQPRIVSVPKWKKIARSGAVYLGKYITGKPLVFNLNLNATTLCNQNCPMCNAVIVGSGKGNAITFAQVKDYLERLKPYSIASLTISGGEPSLVKEMPEILEYTAGKFPFGVNINSNLYGNENIIMRFAPVALKTNTRIGTSFDGLGKTADTLRGATNVAAQVLKNIELVTRLKKEYRSGSTLNMHTVISDANIDQIPDILAISEKYGWTHTLAPVNNFFYQDNADPSVPRLHYSEKLDKVIALALTKKNIAVSRAFLRAIPDFTREKTDKLCPYLTGVFKTFKIFLDPNGDLALCNRVPLGNVKVNTLEEMLASKRYQDDQRAYRACPGCWMACFVEIMLAMPRPYQRLVMNKFAR